MKNEANENNFDVKMVVLNTWVTCDLGDIGVVICNIARCAII